MGEIGHALRDTLLELCRIPSPIGEEKALCDHVQARLEKSVDAHRIERFHDSLIVDVADASDKPRVALVGHLDTVRTQHDAPPRVEGNKLYGAGAADMKSGLAIMLEIAERVNRGSLPYGLTMIFYEREEGPFEENRLGPILETYRALHELDLAVCLEPSDNEAQLGAMGSIHVTLKLRGRTAHSARPWQGENALYKAAEVLRRLQERPHREVEIEGHRFTEVMTPTLIQGGRARNVVPDDVQLNLNYRFAPGQTPEQALAGLRQWLGDDIELEPTDLSPAGRPHAFNPIVQQLTRCGVSGVSTKQAWTDVARFDSVGVPGINLGPGTASQAHQPNEWTELDKLVEGYQIFERFLTGTE